MDAYKWRGLRVPTTADELRRWLDDLEKSIPAARALLTDLELGLRDIKSPQGDTPPTFTGCYSEEELVRIHTLNTLRLCGNNKHEAARRLRISPKTVFSRLKKWAQRGLVE